MTESGLTQSTLDYIERVPFEKRKQLGQFFTPGPLRDALLDGIRLPPKARILDPACGTGEFLISARTRWPDATIEGMEIVPDLAAIAGELVQEATVKVCDALMQPFEPEYDAVIGNPPYFEFKAGADQRERFKDAISGRPNSFALFVLLGIRLLKPGGVLAFVLPPSMNSGAYFRALRSTIAETCRVESLRIEESPSIFQEANQKVMLLRLVKGEEDDGRFVFKRGSHTLFSDNPDVLEALFLGATTLAELGYTVRTGSVVWNQARADLTDDEEGATRLIWSRDIGAGQLEFRPEEGKPAFVRNRIPLQGPAIVVNRITGLGKSASLRAALVPDGMEFVAENHVNVIMPPAGTSEGAVREVVEELGGARVGGAVRRLTGNTQVSSVELSQLIPLALKKS